MLEKPDYQQLYVEGNQQLKNPKNGGYVELSFLEEDKAAKVHPHCLKTLNTIQTVLTKGYAMKDICILVRDNSKGVLLADFLTQHHIPIISAEALLLKNNREIDFLITLLKFIGQPEHNEYQYSILAYLCKNKDQEYDFITQHLDSVAEFIAVNYDFDIRAVMLLPTYDLLELAISKFNLVKNSNAYINYFLDEVLEFGRKESSSLFDFLDFWELKKNALAIAAPDHINAVKIMTVHKSKGLEFPIVIFPFATTKINDRTKSSNLWIPVDPESFNGFDELMVRAAPEIEHYSKIAAQRYRSESEKTELDDFNVLYVALTRAVLGLYIISSSKEDKSISYPSLFKSVSTTLWSMANGQL